MTSDEQAQGGGDPFGGGGFGGFGGFGGRKGNSAGFEDAFQDFGDFFNMGMGGAAESKGQDIMLSITVSFRDAVQGSKKEISFEKLGFLPTLQWRRSRTWHYEL